MPYRIKQPNPAPAPPAGKPMVHSEQTGDPLPTPREDSPDHEPYIPWPQPATGVPHKPMKLK